MKLKEDRHKKNKKDKKNNLQQKKSPFSTLSMKALFFVQWLYPQLVFLLMAQLHNIIYFLFVISKNSLEDLR